MPSDDAQILVGRHAVAEALARRPSQVVELLFLPGERGKAFARILEAARSAGVKVRAVDFSRLEELSQGAVHQGVALRMASQAYTAFEDILGSAQSAGPRGLVVLADHVQDPHNLGAMVRSCAAAGAQGLIIPKDRACPLTPAAAKAAAGALAQLPVSRVTNLTRALEALKEAGLWALAAAAHDAPAPWELDLALPLALVVGGEHKGVGQRLLGACDYRARLPLAPGVESLNASVACGVMLFEVVRQRVRAGI